MNDIGLTPASRLTRFAARPSYLIKVICHMLLGIGVAVALIAKIYMFVLTDYQCTVDLNTLGNKIRCGNTLSIVAHALALSAGFEFAYRLFTMGMHSAIDPLILGVCATFLLIVASLNIENASWQLAAIFVSLTASIGVLLYCKERFHIHVKSGNPKPDELNE